MDLHRPLSFEIPVAAGANSPIHEAVRVLDFFNTNPQLFRGQETPKYYPTGCPKPARHSNLTPRAMIRSRTRPLVFRAPMPPA